MHDYKNIFNLSNYKVKFKILKETGTQINIKECMLNTTKISICIPAYNAVLYINETLHSVKMQTYDNWELIVVEDGPTDGTNEIINLFKLSVKQNVLYYNQNVNVGVSATRNTAVGLANGEWIAFLDSDDLWSPDHLSDLVSISLKFPESQLIHSEISVFNKSIKNVISSTLLSQYIIDALPLSLFDGRYPTQPSSVMMSTDLYKRIGGFNTSLKTCEDKELWFRCVRAGCKFSFTGNATSYYRKHPAALSASYARMAVDMAQVYEIHFEWEDIPKHIRINHTANAWLSAARIYRTINKTLAKEYISNSLKYKVSVKQVLYWLLIHI